jgi:hypothetical protein
VLRRDQLLTKRELKCNQKCKKLFKKDKRNIVLKVGKKEEIHGNNERGKPYRTGDFNKFKR